MIYMPLMASSVKINPINIARLVQACISGLCFSPLLSLAPHLGLCDGPLPTIHRHFNVFRTHATDQAKPKSFSHLGLVQSGTAEESQRHKSARCYLNQLGFLILVTKV